MDKTSTLKEALHDDGSIKAVFSADGQRKVIFLSPALEAMLIDTKTGRNFEWLNCQLRPWSESDSSLAEMLDQASDDQMASSRLALAGSEHVMIAGAAPLANIHNIITHLLVVVEPLPITRSVHIIRQASPMQGAGRVRHLRNLPSPCTLIANHSGFEMDVEAMSGQDHEFEVDIGPSETLPQDSVHAQSFSTSFQKIRPLSPECSLQHSKSETCYQESQPRPTAPRVNKVLGEAEGFRRPNSSSPEPEATGLRQIHASRRSHSQEPSPLPKSALPAVGVVPTSRRLGDAPSARAACRRAASGLEDLAASGVVFSADGRSRSDAGPAQPAGRYWGGGGSASFNDRAGSHPPTHLHTAPVAQPAIRQPARHAPPSPEAGALATACGPRGRTAEPASRLTEQLRPRTPEAPRARTPEARAYRPIPQSGLAPMLERDSEPRLASLLSAQL